MAKTGGGGFQSAAAAMAGAGKVGAPSVAGPGPVGGPVAPPQQPNTLKPVGYQASDAELQKLSKGE